MAKEQYNPKYVKVSQIVNDYSISKYSVYTLIKNGELKAIKIGNKMLVEVESLNEYIKARYINPNEITENDIKNDEQNEN